MTPSLTALDLVVLATVLGTVTWIGDRAAGRARDSRDFFLGGRRLPWVTVSLSILATEISAVTFISLPSVVFRPGGNLTYVQVVLAYGVSRCLVAWLLVPRYLEREIYSPYEYLGGVLGERARRTATGLFLFGGVLAQGARVYLTALILQVLLGAQLEWLRSWTGIPTLLSATLLVVLVALIWTLLGGIATVIWTDALLAGLLLLGLVISLVVLGSRLDESWAAVFTAAADAGKLQWLDWSTDWTTPYTVWAALVGATIGGVGAFGTDQLVAQRLFCCRSVRDARLAMVGSFAGIVITLLVFWVGIALWRHAGQAAWAAEGSATADQIAAQADRVFPIFILWDLPAGLRALVIAGALGAAVSSLDSILTALAQGTLALRRGLIADSAEDSEAVEAEPSRGELKSARRLVVVWSLALGGVGMAMAPLAVRYRAILDLALAMAGLAGGALLAGVLLALWRGRGGRRDAALGERYVYGALVSCLVLVGVVAHSPAAQISIAVAGLVIVGGRLGADPRARWWDALVLAAGCLVALSFSRWGLSSDGRPLAWPWYVPLGATVALVASLVQRGGTAAEAADAPPDVSGS